MTKTTCALFGAAIAGATLIADHAVAVPLPGEQVSVYALGNSLTYGFTGSGVGGRTSDSGWRKQFFIDALNAGLDIDMLGTQNDSDSPGEGGATTVTTNNGVVAFDGDHDGHSGWRIDTTAETGVSNGAGLDDRTASSNQGLLEYVANGTFDTQLGNADFLMLSIGINDVRRGIVNAAGAGSLTGDQAGHLSVGDRLENLIDEIVNGGHGFTGTILVSNITPVATGSDPFGNYAGTQGSFSGDQVNDAIDLANAQIAGLFDGSNLHLTLGGQVQLVDAHGAVNRDTDLVADGLHLNTGGNNALGTVYADTVVAIIPEPGSLALLGLGGVMLAGRRRRA